MSLYLLMGIGRNASGGGSDPVEPPSGNVSYSYAAVDNDSNVIQMAWNYDGSDTDSPGFRFQVISFEEVVHETTDTNTSFSMPDGFHCFVVVARNDGGQNTGATADMGCHQFPGPPAETPPQAAPVLEFISTTPGENNVIFGWTYPGTDFGSNGWHYEIYAEINGNYELIASVHDYSAALTQYPYSFTEDGVYNCYVRAVNNLGAGPNSNVEVVTVPGAGE